MKVKTEFSITKQDFEKNCEHGKSKSFCSRCKSMSSAYNKLKKAIKRRRISKVKHLLKRKFATDKHEKTTALIERLFKDTDNIVESQERIIGILILLFDNGVNINVKNSAGQIILLQLAVKYRLTRVIDFLISRGVSLRERDVNGNSILHFLITNEYNICRKKCDPSKPDENSKVEKKSTKFIRWMLMSKDLDVDGKNALGCTALHLAALYKLLFAIPILLDYTKDVTLVDKCNMTALQTFATSFRNFSMVDIYYSCIYENLPECVQKIYEKFISKGFSVNVVDDTGSTPVHHALKHALDYCRSGYYQAALVNNVNLLLIHCTNVNARDVHGNTVLLMIINHLKDKKYSKFSEEYYKMLRVIVSKGGDINPVGDDQGSILHYLVNSKEGIDSSSCQSLIDLLVSLGCNVNSKDKLGKTPLHHAVQGNSIRIIEALIKSGADVNSREFSNGFSPLHIAVKSGREDLLEPLIKNGADIRCKTWNGNTVLHLVRSPSILEKLLKLGAHTVINACNNRGETVFHELIIYVKTKRCSSLDSSSYSQLSDDYNEMAHILVSNGANVNKVSNEGISPVIFAVEDLNYDLLKLFKYHRADFQCQYKNGNLLHYLIRSKKGRPCRLDHGRGYTSFENILNLLVSQSCDVNGIDAEGKTPLHIALLYASMENGSLVGKLLKSGADVNENVESYIKTLSLTINERWSQCASLRNLFDHLVKLNVANMYVDERWNKYLELYHDTAHIQERCLQEVQQLKMYKLNDSTSLYDFLHVNRNFSCTYINNEKLKRVISSPVFEKNFPMYNTFISFIYKLAVERQKLLEPSKNAWYEFTGLMLPELCVYEILSNLSNNHLKIMIGGSKFP